MKKTISFCCLILILIISCTQKKTLDPNIIAFVQGDNLYRSDIVKILPNNLTKEDSIRIVENFVNNWKFDRLIYEKALKNIGDTTEIYEAIKDYRRQLYVQYYLKELIEKEINVDVDSSEILNYYQSHLNDYILNNSFVKAHYLIMSSKITSYFNVVEKITNSGLDDEESLQKFCIGTNRTVHFLKEWTDINDFLVSIQCPNNISETELPYTKVFEFIVKDKRYIVKIDDFILKGQAASIDFINNEIAQIIINERKKSKYIEIKNNLLELNVTN
ncbi:MAG: hypothetical protein LBV69_07115 [Bacteroidales bacterium]|jgi:hypothetical protein|nr:hypothetical protein [Bacteroidales bacterium]